MKCFYHTDMDGICSAAIIYQNYYNDRGVEFIPIDYKDDFPFEIINKDERVYIVDFSLQKEGDFEKLLKITNDVVWIDHHKTAIEKHKNIEYLFDGVRDTRKAGCMLTWEWFFKTEPPWIVRLIEDHDLWKFMYGDKTRNLQAGIRYYNHAPGSPYWFVWFNDEGIEEVINKGKILVWDKLTCNQSIVKKWSFDIKWHGYNCICCNQGSTNSSLFDSIVEQKGTNYDILIPFVYDGAKWTVSLFSNKPGIDVSEIAKQYGGGGHKGAAGFLCLRLPWEEKPAIRKKHERI